MEAVVAVNPPGPVHAEVKGVAVLPVTVAVRVPLKPAQTAGELTATTGLGLTVRTPEPVPTQPLASVTVTLYVPATPTLMEAVVAVNPPGPVQAYVNGVAVLPVTVALSVPLKP